MESNAPAGMPQTRWTLVLQAAGTDPERACKALEDLYLRYRGPLIGFLRSKGSLPEEPEDLLQGFFEHLISKAGLSKVQKEKGKFRTFLRSALWNFVIDKWRKASNEAKSITTCDKDQPDNAYDNAPSKERLPDSEYDKAWALTLLQSAMDRLTAEYAQRSKAETFEILHPYLAEKNPGMSHEEAGAKTGLSPGAVKTEVSRMRKRYRECIDIEIADTLSRPSQSAIEEEKSELFAALGS